MRNFDFAHLKHMAERFNPLPTNNVFLDTRYEWQRDSNGVEWPYYRFFYHLSAMYKPGIILELGGWQGTGAAHFAAGNESTAVLTVDHHTDSGDEINQEKMYKAQKEFPNIVYLQGWTTPALAAANKGKHSLGDAEDVYQKVVDHTMYYGKTVDILFIDSWHKYAYAMEDWHTYRHFLSNPALVICDDIQEGGDEFSPISGMFQFWNELPGEKFLNANLHPGTQMGFLKYE